MLSATSAPPGLSAAPGPPTAGDSAMLMPPWEKGPGPVTSPKPQASGGSGGSPPRASRVSGRRHRKVRRPAEVDPAIPHHVTVERQAGEPGGEAFEGDA